MNTHHKQRSTSINGEHDQAVPHKGRLGLSMAGLGIALSSCFLIGMPILGSQLFFHSPSEAIPAAAVLITITIACLALMWIISHRTWLEPHVQLISENEANTKHAGIPIALAPMAGIAGALTIFFQSQWGWNVGAMIVAVICVALIIAWSYSLYRFIFRIEADATFKGQETPEADMATRHSAGLPN